jgi:hypothetical protein
MLPRESLMPVIADFERYRSITEVGQVHSSNSSAPSTHRSNTTAYKVKAEIRR